MKTNFIKLLAIAAMMLAASMFTGCDSADEPTPVKASEPIRLSRTETEMVHSQSGFAMKLLRIISNENPGKNVGISPFCVQQALSMLGNGVSDEYQEDYARVLGTSGISDMNALNVRLNESLPIRDPENVSVQIANGMWLNSNYGIVPAFIDVMCDTYASEAATYDFKTVNIADIANGWIAKKTKNGIQNLIPTTYNRNNKAAFILANALYFDAKWKIKFDKSNTEPRAFTDSYGQNGTDVSTMHNRQKIHYVSREKYTMASLPFGQGLYCMMVILPEVGITPDEVLADMTDDELTEAWNQVQLVDADIYMPKVGMTTSGEITSEIMGAGLPLDQITYNNVCKTVSEVSAYQGFNMTLDENGTVIKAAGAVVAGDGAIIAPRDELRINRPFIFGVYEVSSRVFLGLGIINQPDK